MILSDDAVLALADAFVQVQRERDEAIELALPVTGYRLLAQLALRALADEGTRRRAAERRLRLFLGVEEEADR